MTDSTTHRLSSKMETCFLAVFVAYIYVIWFVIQTLTVESWNGIGIFIHGVPSMLFMWFAMRKVRDLPLVAIIILAPFISGMGEFLHLETSALATTGEFTWNHETFRHRSYFFTLYRWTYFYLTWYFGFFVIINYFKFAREAVTAADIRAKHNQAALRTMRYKLNPHFLFNTLNSISTLVLDRRKIEAEKTVENLSRFLRFTIDKTPDIQVPLSEEVDVAKKYIEIERLRFSDKLDVTYDITSDSLECLVPNLILQSVLEYLTTHHVLLTSSQQCLNVRSYVSQDTLHIECEIEGQLNTSIGSGALEACDPIAARLEEHFQEKGILSVLVGSDNKQGLTVTLPKVLS